MNDFTSSFRRKQTNIDKAIYNQQVNTLLAQHYTYLHSLLVRRESEEDIFNDTYLKLTYNYNPDQDFIEQFKYYFSLLKGAYYRADKVSNYVEVSEAYDIADTVIEVNEEPKKKDTRTLSDFKNTILNAIPKKTYKKRAEKRG